MVCTELDGLLGLLKLIDDEPPCVEVGSVADSVIGGGVAIVVRSDTKLVGGISLSAVLVGSAGVEIGSAEEPDREVVWVRTGRDPSEVVVIPDTVNELMETSVID